MKIILESRIDLIQACIIYTAYFFYWYVMDAYVPRNDLIRIPELFLSFTFLALAVPHIRKSFRVLKYGDIKK